LTRFCAILAALADHVPVDIELLFHFCYGDSNHKHVIEPTDMGDMVDVANRLSVDIRRTIQLIHMPVPRGRKDDDYFAPLARLRLKPETELCLGLVHYTDGAAGTRERLATAERHIGDFSIWPPRPRDHPRIAPYPFRGRGLNRAGTAGRAPSL
jgi:hypothetical protein